MNTNPPHGGTPMASPSLPPADIQPYTGAQALLQNPLVRDGMAERQARRARTAERYNVFDALGIGRRENYHSRFIAYLLNPAGLHDQGAVFLRSLLHWLCKQRALNAVVAELDRAQSLASNAVVHTERHTPEHGRIDLVVELSNGTTIAIENKVDAQEREYQIQDYSKYLKSLPAARRQALMLVFLTPDGRDPVTAGTADVPIVLMSYTHLAGVLEDGLAQCAQTAIPLIESVKHYVQLCRRITSETPDMTYPNQQLKELLLKEPAQLEAAYELAAHIALAEQGIKAQFLDHVVDELVRRLSEAGLQASPWRARATPDGWYVGIMAEPMGVAPPGYRCLACMRSKGWLAIGWHNPEGNGACADEELKNEMLGQSGWWPGEGMFAASNMMNHQPWAQPLLDWNSAAGIKAMQLDNLDTHDLACKLAREIWEHFHPFQARVLNGETLPAVRSSCTAGAVNPGLSTLRLAAWRQCPRRLWLQVHRPGLQEEAHGLERSQAIGYEVKEGARALFADGILIDQELGVQAALEATREATGCSWDR